MSPADTPPADGDVDRGPVVLTVTIVTTVLALLVVVLRMFVRIKIVKNVGWDDHTIIGATLLAILVMVFEIISVRYGLGRHMFYLTPESLNEASKWSRATTPPNLASCALARISLCLFFMRIVERRRGYIAFLWALIVLNIVVNLMVIIRMLASCRPLEKLWNPTIPGQCWPARTALITGTIQGAVSISTDWLIALFPIVILSKLNMAVRTKLVLVALMGMGMFAGVAALLKMMHLNALATRPDSTWDVVDLVCWSIVEQNTGIIAVSVPAIRPLFARIFRIATKSSDPRPGRDNPYLNDYHLDKLNASGRQNALFVGGGSNPAAVSSASASATRNAKPLAVNDAGTGSESSLVRDADDGRRGADGIRKTVSVSLRSGPLDEEGKLATSDVEKGMETSWFGK